MSVMQSFGFNAVIAALAMMTTACASAVAEPVAAEQTPPQIYTATIDGKTFVVLPAEAPVKVYWSEFGEPFDSYFGLEALSNGKKKGDAATYQCTELIHRYVSTIYGFPSRIGLGMGDGNALAEGIAEYFRGQTRSLEAIGAKHVSLEYFVEGKSKHPPVVGSIISMHFTLSEKGSGHVAILRELSEPAPGELAGTLFAQHGKMGYKIGAEVVPDTVHFKQTEDGTWNGIVRSPFFGQDFRIVGWTTAVVQP
jgi:hypothetical protein